MVKLNIKIRLIRQVACLWAVFAVAAFNAPITACAESAPKAKQLLLLGDRDYPPVNFIENGVAKGVMIDIVRAISQAVGRQVKIELTDWKDAQVRVQKGEADGLIGMSVTEERKKLFDFTEPVARNEFSLFVRSTEMSIRGINDLAGLTVAVTGGGLPRQFMETRSGIRLVPVDTYRDGLERLTDGRVDVFAADRWVAAYTAQKNHIHGVKIVGAPFASLPAAIAFRKGNPQLVGECNRAIEELQRNGTIGRVLDTWRPQEMVFITQGRVREIVIAAVSVFLLIIAAFMALWIAALKKQIRERKRTEESLRLSEDRLRATIEKTPNVAVQWYDEQGRILFWNQASERIFGWNAEDAIGRTLGQLIFTPEEGVSFRDMLPQIKQNGKTIGPCEFNFHRKDGTEGVCLSTIFDIPFEEGTSLFVCMDVDVTERKQADTEIRLLLEQVQQNAMELEKHVAERTAQLKAANEQLEAFAYSVSHDLKAPLRGIDGYSRLLLQDYAPHLDDDGRFFIITIRESAQQMQQLIDDLLAYSRLERRNMAVGAIQLPAFADAVLDTFSSQMASRGITLKKTINPATIQADAEGLGIALRNLVDNSIKFTLNTPEPVIEIGGNVTETSYVLWVRDNGIGFDMQYHDRIFEIFQRLQRAEEYPGTGIGLALVNKSMERMNGRTWAESKTGKGATFYLEVPR
ncbi:MAG: transporter substrate-binding domain-containing protein [Oryzomonas sp.]|uniref:transporter substrate-binding domain-containing protein n=1 Tax=Oryzomonas sp. TaxID=2855186 RepID=UPI002845ED89|nr:transporter substrate-binding domain-containing protein [Oryzomonas sp.]MDR3581590.1 transporter substrate-binding domain-containing protein [Oryzomonas sp.]